MSNWAGLASAGVSIERLESTFRVGQAKMSRIGAHRAANKAFEELVRSWPSQNEQGGRETVVPREKPPHPYSPVGGSMFTLR